MLRKEERIVMAFQEYLPRVYGSRLQWKDCVEISNRHMRFSKDFWQRELEHSERIRIWYNKEENLIGLIPVHDRDRGLKVKVVREVVAMNCTGFTKSYQLFFEKPTIYLIKNSGDKINPMRIFDLNKGANIRQS